jgi:aryl-alcohol dehydrogenase-like predicted oxidoreductase
MARGPPDVSLGSMRYKLLGRSGLRVSELALGTMTFGEDWGWGASREESRRIFDRFAEAGGNFVDTSNNYTNGTSERFVGEFASSDRQHFVIATKYSLTTRDDDPNAGGNHRKNMVHALEASLSRLGTDYVDLLWLHMWDGTTPVEEVLRAFDDLVRAGKVLYVGLSDTPAWVVSRAVTMAELRGWARPVAVQLPYSALDRSVEREVLPVAKGLDLAVTPWGLLEGGVLTGKYRRAGQEPKRYGQAAQAELALGDAVVAIAEEVGRTPSQVAINWVRQQQDRAEIIPIVGARTLDQLESNLGCLEFELSAEHLDHLSAASGFTPGFPSSFLDSPGVRKLIFGETYPLIDDHRR